jgi:hypothetical protein
MEGSEVRRETLNDYDDLGVMLVLTHFDGVVRSAAKQDLVGAERVVGWRGCLGQIMFETIRISFRCEHGRAKLVLGSHLPAFGSADHPTGGTLSPSQVLKLFSVDRCFMFLTSAGFN